MIFIYFIRKLNLMDIPSIIGSVVSSLSKLYLVLIMGLGLYYSGVSSEDANKKVG